MSESRHFSPIVIQDPETFDVYVRLSDVEKSASTAELYPGRVLADFDNNGNLIGVEIM